MTHCNGTNPGHFGEAASVQEEAGAEQTWVSSTVGRWAKNKKQLLVCITSNLELTEQGVEVSGEKTRTCTSDAEESQPRIQSIIRLSSQTGKASV
ncbi:hypothetical protein BN1723_000850 [Verticillium longisporum]|nr:hypothetical protein BN1723_000850 [Verticillium longisporum]